MVTSSFHFKIGDILQLQRVDRPESERKNVKLIGCLEGKSIIVTAPSHDGKLILVREDQHFVVRMFSDNTVQAFNAHVLKAYQRPYPYFHLSFPDECEAQVVRRAHRVDLDMIISVRNTTPDKPEKDNGKIAAKLTNLSTAGAEIICKTPLGDSGDYIDAYMKLSIGGVEKYLSLPAEIKRVKNLDEIKETVGSGFAHGVQFLPMTDEEVIVLHGFVYESLIKR